MILKRNNKSVRAMFFYVKVYIFWKFIQCAIHWGNTNVKKISFGQKKVTKMHPVMSSNS